MAERTADGVGVSRSSDRRASEVLKAVLIFAAFALAWVSLRSVHLGPRLVAIVLLVFGTIHVTSSIRPQVWTFLFLGVLCRALMSENARVRRVLPALFAVWANCHGGWIVGLGVLGVWAAIVVIAERAPFVEWTAIVLGCTLATLVTPYGWRLWQFMAETVRLTRHIAEWGPALGHAVPELDSLVRRGGGDSLGVCPLSAPSHRRRGSSGYAGLFVRARHADRIALRPVGRHFPCAAPRKHVAVERSSRLDSASARNSASPSSLLAGVGRRLRVGERESPRVRADDWHLGARTRP